MAKTKPISVKTLRQLLRCNPETGEIFYLPRPVSMFKDDAHMRSWNTRFANKRAFTTIRNKKDCYPCGAIFYRTYPAHRIVWAMYYGKWPQGEIDHINGIRDDNRITNLRSVTLQENQHNQKRPKNNTSGAIGVFWDKEQKKWRAQINFNKRIYVGRFATKDEAIKARKAAEIKYGFHPNHGRS